MIERTFVTFGKPIASAQVIATKLAVKIKLLKMLIRSTGNLRFVAIIRLS